MKVYCVFSLESPHWDDSNEYTQYTIFNMNMENTLNYTKSVAMWIYPRDSRTSSKQPWQMRHQCWSHWSSTVLDKSLSHWLMPQTKLLLVIHRQDNKLYFQKYCKTFKFHELFLASFMWKNIGNHKMLQNFKFCNLNIWEKKESAKIFIAAALSAIRETRKLTAVNINRFTFQPTEHFKTTCMVCLFFFAT